MTAIANYGELKVALSDYVDQRNIAYVLPRLVQQAESRLNRELRTRFQLTTTALTLVSGAVALPSDFLEMAHVYGTNGYQYRSGPLSDSMRTTSQYSRYSIDDSDININGYSGGRTIAYFAKLPTLTTSNATTNWLLANYPDVYLYAVGFEAAKYLKDAELIAASKAALDDALLSVRVDDDRARWSNTTVRVQGINP
ncbi:hypothetical protein [uncultured Bradyrhizobium sp.]|uniref:phage adaptor protein n=1 Tax=uncultured Bradyrhizobium sp. TaxID=199684 RepID=UPI0035C9E7BA